MKPLIDQLNEYFWTQAQAEQSRGWQHVRQCLGAALITFAFSALMLWLTVRQWPVYPSE